MEYSCFTEYGLFEFSSEKPAAQQIYEDLSDAKGEAFDMTPGTIEEAITYAQAMGVARANASALRAGDVYMANDLIPALEKRYRIIPPASATIDQRRAAINAKRQAPTGASSGAIETALTMLLGANFLAYYPLPLSMTHPATVYPSDPTTVGSFVSAKVEAKLFQLIDPIAILNVPIMVAYQEWNQGLTAWQGKTFSTAPLYVNDRVVTQAENGSQAEAVTVLASQLGRVGVAPASITAVFTKAHDPGSSLCVGRKPLWTSLKRFSLVIVKSVSALDANTRNAIHEVMRQHARGLSQWAIVQPTSPGATTAGPFTVGTPVGVTPIGVVNIP